MRFKVNALDPTGLSPIEDSVVIASTGGSGGPSTSIGVTGEPQLTGEVTLTAGSNITLTQTGQDISIASSGGGGGGGSAVSYYLNGSVNQGTFGGNTYYEMNRSAVVGTGTNFTISTNGYIAQFLTDAGDPNSLKIPGGNWNFEMYFSASSNGGSPSFYLELYKYNGTTFTLIASGSTSPEIITGGTAKDIYFTALTVPETTLTLTDRLAIRIYVSNSSRTITLYTEDNNLCQVNTTFSSGITSLNGLTTQVQSLATGTSGSDFNISSVTDTHTFNLPTASNTNRGALSSADWTTFNNKQPALGYTAENVANKSTTTTLGTSDTLYPTQNAVKTYVDTQDATKVTANSAITGATKTKITYDSKGLVTAGADATTADIADSLNKRYVTDAQLTVIGNTSGTNTGDETQTTIKTKLGAATTSTDGYLTSTDWNTFNNKQAALGFTPENVANKSTTTTLGTSNTLYPTQNAVKTYVDNLTGATQTRNEVPTGTVNGTNATFTLAATPAANSQRIYKNGVRLKAGSGNDYTISGTTITMATAPATGTVLLADYEVASGTFAQGVSTFITNEVPSGTINGSNTAFTTVKSYVAGTLEVYINGVKQQRTTHYTETTPASGTFSMSDAPITGDLIEVRYQNTLSSVGDANSVGGYSVVGLVDLMYPVGSIYTSTVSTNPGTLFGRGTWSAYGKGQVLVGKADSGTFVTAGATGGAETHTLSTAEIPSHNHANNSNTVSNAAGRAWTTFTTAAGTQLYDNASSALNTASTGGGGSHNNLQPYIVVYMWKRDS